MSSEIHVCAIVTPAKGKEARVKELLTGLASNVKAKEKDVSKYEVFEQFNGEGGNVFIVEEIYKDQATLDTHFVTEYFQALERTIGEENLLAAPPDIKTMRPIAGFASR